MANNQNEYREPKSCSSNAKLLINYERINLNNNFVNYNNAIDVAMSEGENDMPRKKKRLRKKLTFNGVTQWISAYTKADLKAKEIAFFANIDPNRLLPKQTTVQTKTVNAVNFKDFANKWFTIYKEPNLRQSTIAMYRNLFNAHIFPIFENYNLHDINADMLQEFFNKYRTKSTSIVAKLYVTFDQIFRKAVQQDILNKNPVLAVEKPKGEVTERLPIPYESVQPLTDALLQHRFGLLPLLCMYCGLRRGEALALYVDDFKNGQVTINKAITYVNGMLVQGAPKTKAGYRTVPVPAFLWDMVQLRSGLVFGTVEHWGYSKYKRVWNTLKTDIPLLENYTLHSLRHTYNMLMRRAGVDESTRQYLMGHDDFKMTAKTYTHIDAHDIAEAKEKLFKLMA